MLGANKHLKIKLLLRVNDPEFVGLRHIACVTEVSNKILYSKGLQKNVANRCGQGYRTANGCRYECLLKGHDFKSLDEGT